MPELLALCFFLSTPKPFWFLGSQATRTGLPSVTPFRHFSEISNLKSQISNRGEASQRAGATPAAGSIFQAVRSGLLRFKRAWLPVRIRPSPTSRGGSSRVEHVNTPVRLFSWILFLGSEDKVTSATMKSPFPRQQRMRKRAPTCSGSRGSEGLQGTCIVERARKPCCGRFRNHLV